MLIPLEKIKQILSEKNINLTGAFHIGAHECEELDAYKNLGLNPKDVVWIDAIPFNVEKTTNRGIPNVYAAVITDKDDEDIIFNISNNVQSSSVLEFGTHSYEHPGIVYVDKIQQKTITIDTFFKRHNLDASKYDLWNFDIQGAELMALKGGTESIKFAKAIYLEITEHELYIGCGLVSDIDAFLAQYGFKRVLTTMTGHGWGDALYVLE
jgi:FkbM family methyltransferase